MVKKAKKKSASIHIITALFVVVTLVYLYRFFAFRIDTDIVRFDSLENTVETECVFIKHEWTTVLPGGTELDYKAEEGERVSVGKPILKISKNTGVDENISLKIAQINERIEEIKKSDADNNFFAQDKQKIDASIENNIKTLKSVTASGDLSKLEAVKNELTADVYKKSLIYGTNSFSGQNLEQLMQEKATLEQLQKNNLDMIYSRTAGLVSYELDGYEAALNPANIKGLKVGSIQEVVNDINEKSKNKKETVEAAQGVKVVDNFEWYIAAVLPHNVVNKDRLGKTIRVRFKELGDTVVTGVLAHFDLGNEQGNLVVIKSDEQIQDLQSIRTAKVEIVTKFSEGLIIPTKCIIEKEGLKGVYIERNGLAKFVPIKVLIVDQQEALIGNLTKEDKGYDRKNFTVKPYDRIITSVNKVRDGQMLPGAF